MLFASIILRVLFFGTLFKKISQYFLAEAAISYILPINIEFSVKKIIMHNNIEI